MLTTNHMWNYSVVKLNKQNDSESDESSRLVVSVRQRISRPTAADNDSGTNVSDRSSAYPEHCFPCTTVRKIDRDISFISVVNCETKRRPTVTVFAYNGNDTMNSTDATAAI